MSKATIQTHPGKPPNKLDLAGPSFIFPTGGSFFFSSFLITSGIPTSQKKDNCYIELRPLIMITVSEATSPDATYGLPKETQISMIARLGQIHAVPKQIQINRESIEMFGAFPVDAESLL